MYANDVGSYLKGQYRLFADDTILIASHKDPEIAKTNIEADFRRLQIWAHNNKISINRTKTEFIHIKPKRHTQEVGDTIKYHTHECLHKNITDCQCKEGIMKVTQIKYLGVWLDDKFTFHKHIESLQKRMRSALYQIYQMKKYANTKILKTIYYALVESITSYGIEAWGRADPSYKKEILMLQDKIAYTLLPHKTQKKIKNRKETYKTLDVLPIDETFKYKLIIENYYREEFKKKPNERYPLRTQRSYTTPVATNSYERKTEAHIIPHLFNSIPEEHRNIEKIGRAKKSIKNHLIQHVADTL